MYPVCLVSVRGGGTSFQYEKSSMDTRSSSLSSSSIHLFTKCTVSSLSSSSIISSTPRGLLAIGAMGALSLPAEFMVGDFSTTEICIFHFSERAPITASFHPSFAALNKMATILENQNITDRAIVYSNRANVIIRNCTFTGCSVLFNKCTNPRVQKCTFINSKGPSTHAVQFNACTGGYIGYNEFREVRGASAMSDIINIYKSNGTERAPIVIEYNYLKGGGPHASGGGIMLGDNGGQWQIARNNVVIEPGQYGMAIAGGGKHEIRNNIVMSQSYSWTNVGIYVWGIPQRNSFVDGAQIVGNTVYWKSRTGKSNPWWLGARTSNVVLRTNTFNAPFNVPAKRGDVGAPS